MVEEEEEEPGGAAATGPVAVPVDGPADVGATVLVEEAEAVERAEEEGTGKEMGPRAPTVGDTLEAPPVEAAVSSVPPVSALKMGPNRTPYVGCATRPLPAAAPDQLALPADGDGRSVTGGTGTGPTDPASPAPWPRPATPPSLAGVMTLPRHGAPLPARTLAPDGGRAATKGRTAPSTTCPPDTSPTIRGPPLLDGTDDATPEAAAAAAAAAAVTEALAAAEAAAAAAAVPAGPRAGTGTTAGTGTDPREDFTRGL